MKKGWENFEPAPMEFMHGRLLDLFHKYRIEKTNKFTVDIDGIEFNNIVAKAKKMTYEKYHSQGLDKPIHKSKM